MPENRLIVTIKKKAGAIPYVNKQARLNLPATIFIWQDELTASAAESQAESSAQALAAAVDIISWPCSALLGD
ncbi:MAG: hypothetical protein HQK57_09670 [Deltaproteobacteria bacterium]|nr:hypothetical protein [Deltaproteobacteria bacterium]MBF0526597.1 hypothetical protein [Deltaproteobacteria bacterium]